MRPNRLDHLFDHLDKTKTNYYLSLVLADLQHPIFDDGILNPKQLIIIKHTIQV